MSKKLYHSCFSFLIRKMTDGDKNVELTVVSIVLTFQFTHCKVNYVYSFHRVFEDIIRPWASAFLPAEL